MHNSTETFNLLKSLILGGANFWVENNQLKFNAPKNLLNDTHKQYIRDNRQDCIDLIKNESSVKLEKIEFNQTAEASKQQQAIYLLQQKEPNNPVYNIPKVFKLKGKVNIHKMKKSIEFLMKKYEILRTRFVFSDGKINTSVNNLDHVPLSVEYCAEENLEIRTNEIVHEAFNLNVSPLFKINILELAEESALIFLFHHSIADGVTIKKLLSDLEDFYLSDEYPTLIDEKLVMNDYTSFQNKWLNSINASILKDKLKDKLSGYVPIELSYSGNNEGGSWSRFQFPVELSDKITKYCRENSVSEYSILLSSFSILLHSYFNRDDIIIGSTYADRDNEQSMEIAGFLVNPVLFRIFIDYNIDIISFIKTIQNESITLHDYKRIPLVDVLSLYSKETSQTLTNFMFDYVVENSTSPLPFTRIEGSEIDFNFKFAKFPLTFSMTRAGNVIKGIIEWKESFFSNDYISLLLEHFEHIVSEIVERKVVDFSDLNFATPQELENINTWNSTNINTASNQNLINIFSKKALNNCNQAIIYGDIKITYNDLDIISTQLANYLEMRGAKAGDIVGICLDRSPEMLVAIIAILKLGATYLPLDPSYPMERLAYIIDDSETKLIITNKSKNLESVFQNISILLIDQDIKKIKKQSSNRKFEFNFENLAYIIYTSGSTGKPKGVKISHKNVLNYVNWFSEKFAVHETDVFDFSSSFAFDLSVTCTLLPLLTGSSISIADDDTKKDALLYLEHLNKNKITFLKCTPSYFSQLYDFVRDINLDDLRFIILGGEAIRNDDAVRWIKKFVSHQIVNEYGPTEATVATVAHIINYNNLYHTTNNTYPIGKPAFNTKIYILNSHNKVCPLGGIGELYISGTSVGLGYLNRLEMTNEKFLNDPINPMIKMYKTGDLATWLPDGNLYYYGRIDQQVKIRGYRIELGEIASCLRQHHLIHDAIAVTRPINGNNQLVAYYLSKDNLNVNELKTWMSGKLPEYMIPVFILKIDFIPLTVNAKLDLAALSDPISTININNEVELTGDAKKIAGVWEHVLKVNNISLDDNFFELGGDSIACLQVISKLYELNFKFSVKDLFEAKTIRILLSRNSNKNNIRSEEGILTGPLPLSPIQKLFFNKSFIEINHWNQIIEVKCPTNIDVQLIKQLFDIILKKHDVLRVNFKRNDNTWFAEYQDDVNIESILSIVNAEEPSSNIISSNLANIQTEINIQQGSLFRVLLINDSDSTKKLFLIAHHLIIDAVSWRILLDDLNSIYKNLLIDIDYKGKTNKSTSFRQWSCFLEDYAMSNKLLDELDYWNQIDSSQNISLQNDKSIKNIEQDSEVLSCSFNYSDTKMLINECKRLGISLNDVLITGLLRALFCYYAERNWLINLESHGRENLNDSFDLSNSVGWFTSLYPVALKINFEKSIIDQIKEIKQTLKSIPQNGIGYGVLKFNSNLLKSPVNPEICFNYLGKFDSQNSDEETFQLISTAVGGERSPKNERLHLLEINSLIKNDIFECYWLYNAKILEKNDINNLVNSFIYEVKEVLNCIKSIPNKLITPADFPRCHLTQVDLDKIILGHGFNIDICKATNIQQGFIYHSLQNRGDYLTQLSWDLSGALDVVSLTSCWNKVFDKYSILRACFVWEGLSHPLQVIRSNISLPISILDWTTYSSHDQHIKFHELINDDRIRGFDINKDILTRVYLIKQSDFKYKLIWSFDHLILDGWSLSIILNDLFSLYEKKDINLIELDGFADYCRWFDGNTNILNLDFKFWNTYLKDLNSISQFPKLIESKSSKEFISRIDSLSFEESQKFKIFSKANNITLNTLVQATWAFLLSKYTHQSDVIFGVTVSGRNVTFPRIDKAVGMFINTLPLRVRIDKNRKIVSWLTDLQENMRQIGEFETISLSDISDQIGLNIADYIKTNIVFDNYPVEDKVLANQSANTESAGVRIGAPEPFVRSGYPLSLIIIPGDQLGVKFIFDNSCYSSDFIESLSKHFLNTLNYLVANSQDKISDIKYIDDQENAIILQKSKGSFVSIENKFVFEKISETALKYPEKIALYQDNLSITFHELNSRVNRLANYLLPLTINRNEIIGICCNRSIDSIIAMLAINKAGGAYLTFDPEYPQDRVNYILSDTKMRIVLAHKQYIDIFSGIQLTVAIDDLPDLNDLSNFEPMIVNQPNDIMYVIYTSGSTGLPKGVLVEHLGVMNYVQWAAQFFEDNNGCGVPIHSSLCFDLTITALFPPLVNGHSLHILDEKKGLDGLISCIQEGNKFSLIKLTPSHLSILHEAFNDDLSYKFNVVIVGGETLSYQYAELFQSDSCKLVNHYGPTEATCGCIANLNVDQSKNELSCIPVGLPINNMNVYILDDSFNPVPEGIPGELFIGGPGVAKGYLNKIELTNQKFINAPFNNDRLYRTGDWVRRLGNGEILFLGRIDHQVKFNGYRIELTEIENALLAHGDIKNAAVILKNSNQNITSLVAFYEIGDFKLESSEILDFLRESLPKYMLPSQLIQVDSLPLNGNGKIDRKSLEEIQINGMSSNEIVTPETDTEKAVHDIWCEVFGRNEICLTESFVELGGHSLKAVQIISRVIKNLKINVPIYVLIQSPTIRQFSEALDLMSSFNSDISNDEGIVI
jgi:bacitracin synthase 3